MFEWFKKKNKREERVYYVTQELNHIARKSAGDRYAEAQEAAIFAVPTCLVQARKAAESGARYVWFKGPELDALFAINLDCGIYNANLLIEELAKVGLKADFHRTHNGAVNGVEASW